ncbi:hypothetical protein KM043_000667 [Ampulex compressa]|nr:hypothetical protein KM043_000667 [Ampulex compressa]
MDQHFGRQLNPERYFDHPFFDRSPFAGFPFAQLSPWERPSREDERGWSMVKDDKDKFNVVLDVQQFKPDEVTVKVVDNCIIVEGKHDEKQDDHGMISRHFIRKYLVPEQCDAELTTSTLSSDGILTITSPRKPEAIEDKREKVIEVQHTGQPALEKKQDEKPKQ